MINNKKPPTEKEFLQLLGKGEIEFPPLTFRTVKELSSANDVKGFDAFIEATWEKKMVEFAVEYKTVSTPKAFQFTLYWMKVASQREGLQPLLIVPFLSESQLEELEREKFNGIDLCGNGCISVPGKFSVFRGGKENRFGSSSFIKNIYRKNSSMVGRSFLAKPSYETVQEVCSEVNSRNLLVLVGEKIAMGLSTVSKVLKSLEEDLIIERKENIRLLQPEKLLEKLNENYISPEIKNKIRLKVPTDVQEFLSKQSKELKMPIVATGVSSVSQYAVMQRGELFSVYCPDIDKIKKLPFVNELDRFPNLEIFETDDETVYFDSRRENNFTWSSPVQTYLELMSGDKRDKETASQVKSFIQEEIKKAKL